jgi:Rieske 2Fe-2S family protein
VAGFMTLPARYYTDADLFRREMERFYFNHWICAGRAEAIPHAGDYFLREVAGESVIVTRDASGGLRAFYNVCRHRGTRLCSEPQGNFGARIVCPYHAWSYGLDGCLLGAPQMEGPGSEGVFSREKYPLHAVCTAVWDGHVFLHLGHASTSLEDQLGLLPRKFAPWRMHELRLYKRIVYDVKANWKLAVLNYNECLHCPMVHPALNRWTDYLGADNEPSHPHYLGGAMGFRGGAETMTLDGQRRRDYLPGLSESERKQVFYYTIFPNLLLSLHPDYMMVHTLWPQAVDRTRIVCEFHFHPAEMAKPGFIGDDAVEFWDQTNREDWRVVELSQAGIQSRAYTPGPYSRREELLRAFDEMVRENDKP